MNLLSLNCNRFRDETILKWLSLRTETDIICLQEADIDIIKEIFPDHTFYKAGKKKSDKWSVPLIGLTDRFEMMWTSRHSRTLPLKILDKTTGKTFCLVNVHLKANYKQSFHQERVNGIRSVLSKLDATFGESSEDKEPTIILGDFNAPLGEPCLELLDHMYRVDLKTKYTLTHFKGGWRLLVDHVFVTKSVKIMSVECVVAPSDHLAILIKIYI